jgi:hypothetical protein
MHLKGRLSSARTWRYGSEELVSRCNRAGTLPGILQEFWGPPRPGTLERLWARRHAMALGRARQLVPESTHRAGIQLNERVSLLQKWEIVSLSALDIASIRPNIASRRANIHRSKSREPAMSDLFATKQVDGYPAKFVRFAGPDNFIIEVNGAERIVTREYWRTLSLRETGKMETAKPG